MFLYPAWYEASTGMWLKSALFWDSIKCTELLCHVKSQKSADLAVAFLHPFAFHIHLPLTFLTIGALLLVHLISLSSPSALTTVMYVASNTWIWSLFISCMFSSTALHLIQSNSFISLFLCLFIPFPFYCVFLTFPLAFCNFVSHLV